MRSIEVEKLEREEKKQESVRLNFGSSFLRTGTERRAEKNRDEEQTAVSSSLIYRTHINS